MEQIILPTIYCPFPSQINPLVESTHTQSLAWAQHFQLVQREKALKRFNACRFAWLTDRVHPTANGPELTLVNEWLVWLFMLDDQFDDGSLRKQPERMQQIMREFAHSLSLSMPDQEVVSSSNPLSRALLDLWRRTYSCMHPLWRERFIQHFADYFASLYWEAQNRVSDSIPDLPTYITKRRDLAGMPIALDLAWLVEHIDLPQDVYVHPTVQILIETTSNVVGWTNDVFSFEKELAQGENSNLVVVAQHTYKCSQQEALDYASALITSEVERFLATRPLLPVFTPAVEQQLQRYVQMLATWMRGNLDWSIETLRYKHASQVNQGGDSDYIEALLS